MDLGNLFKALDEDYRDIMLAASIGFPIAYLDCWKLHSDFRNYDVIPQIMLSLGVDFIFIGAGILFCIWYWYVTKHHPNRPPYPEFNIFILLIAFTASSALVLVNAIKTPMIFESYYLGFTTLYIVVAFLKDRCIKRNASKKRNCNDYDNDDLKN